MDKMLCVFGWGRTVPAEDPFVSIVFFWVIALIAVCVPVGYWIYLLVVTCKENTRPQSSNKMLSKYLYDFPLCQLTWILTSSLNKQP